MCRIKYDLWFQNTGDSDQIFAALPYGAWLYTCVRYQVTVIKYVLRSNIYHISYILHLYSTFRTELQCQFSNIASQLFFCQATLHTVLFLIEGSHPLPDQLPGEHTGLPSHTMAVPLYHSACWMQHSLTHSHVVDKSMVDGHVPTHHTYSFMFTSHIDMIAHNLAFLQVG